MAFTSIHQPPQDDETADRLRFVSGWLRILGVGCVVLWILAGAALVVTGFAERQLGQGLLIGGVGAALGILLTTPLYFWFAAIASGLATLVDRSGARP